jgi:hypothetical protein
MRRAVGASLAVAVVICVASGCSNPLLGKWKPATNQIGKNGMPRCWPIDRVEFRKNEMILTGQDPTGEKQVTQTVTYSHDGDSYFVKVKPDKPAWRFQVETGGIEMCGVVGDPKGCSDGCHLVPGD